MGNLILSDLGGLTNCEYEMLPCCMTMSYCVIVYKQTVEYYNPRFLRPPEYKHIPRFVWHLVTNYFISIFSNQAK